MADLTVQEIKAGLINHGVELPSASAKKDEYVALYDQHIPRGEKEKLDFSSDEEVTFSSDAISTGHKVTKKRVSGTSNAQKVSRKSVGEGINGPTENSNHVGENQVTTLTEENSLMVGDVDVSQLSDGQLSTKLKEFNVDVGPIVDSTRAVYRKKLAISMREQLLNVDKTANVTVETNGIHDDMVDGDGLQNGDYSADDEEMFDVSAPKEDKSEDEQPSLLVRPSVTPTPPEKTRGSTRSASRTSTLAKTRTALADIRQRFTGTTKESNVENERYTPTPRRSIHSYKVTETRKETITKMKDGTVSRDFDYKKETSTNQDELGGDGLVRKMLRYVPPMFLLMIFLTVGYYIYVKLSLFDDVFESTKGWIAEFYYSTYDELNRMINVKPEKEHHEQGDTMHTTF